MKTLTLSTKLLVVLFSLGILSLATSALATTNWELQAPSSVDFSCGGGTYSHTLDTLTQDEDGTLTGTGYYDANPAYTWDLTGSIVGDAIDFTITYTGLAAGTVYNSSGTIAPDGSVSGATDNNCDSFAMPAGSALFMRTAEITSPGDGEIVTGVVPFSAVLVDAAGDDAVQWAVREGTCDAGIGTVWGNVDGNSDPYDWDGADFYSEADTTGWTPGAYCFVFNPTESPGDTPIRETREFYVAGAYVHGGGQIVEEMGGKRKNWSSASFGGWVADIGELVGEWQINVHNDSDDEFDKGKFHTEEFTALNLFAPTSDTCESAMNFDATGTWNGEEGYTLTFRAGESGNPASVSPDDTVRMTISGPDGFLYETSESFLGGDYTNESSCVGVARTNLDAGNITIIEN